MPTKSHEAGVKARCALVKQGIQQSEAPVRVKQMLCTSLDVTLGTQTSDRSAFNESFVKMIAEVLQAEHSRLEGEVASKDEAFKALTPTKGTREAALEEAKADAKTKSEALATAKQAVTDANAAVKAAIAETKAAKKAQTEGDAALEATEAKKAAVEGVVSASLQPIVDGTAAADAIAGFAKTVLDTGRSYEFDSSLLSTATTLLEKPAGERGSFDQTCMQQIQDAFSGLIAKFDAELKAGAPGKAERAAAVEKAEADKTAAESTQADAKAKAAAAQEAKAAADAVQRTTNKSLNDFMPDLKEAGDAFDDAKNDLQSFIDGSEHAYNELKVFSDDDFQKLPYYEVVDGYKCDRAVLAACRESVDGGDTPGRVSEDDAKKVFATIADGGKVTSCERWTLRYCLLAFAWTDKAQDWIVSELKGVHTPPAKKQKVEGKSYYQQIDGMKLDRDLIDACSDATEGEGKDGRVSADDAAKIWVKAQDGQGVTNVEKWTLRYCLGVFSFHPAAHDYIVNEMKKLDAAAAAAAAAPAAA